MLKLFRGLLIIGTVLILGGCSAWDNFVNKTELALTSGNYKVTLYSGGKVVRVWLLPDVLVQNETSSDGFMWSLSGKITRVSGDLVVEEISEIEMKVLLN